MAQAKKKTVSVIDRRLASGSVFSSLSRAIPLVEPAAWELRIVNTEIGDARLWAMQMEKGWAYAELSDLAVDPVEIGFRVQDGRIVRGTHGHEVLMKMAAPSYRKLRKFKESENRRNTFGDKAVMSAIVSAAEREPDGGRGAEFLSQTVQTARVIDSSERVSLED